MKKLIRELKFLKILFSPFRLFKLKFYIGKVAIGTPYYFPRRWVKIKDKPGYTTPIPKKIGFDLVGLGYKTKWTATDYRHEWSPLLSFVFFKWQIAVIVYAEHDSHYWESWLYYENHTDKTKSKEDRIIQCIKKFPQIWRNNTTETDYYNLILKDKYIKLNKKYLKI